MACLHDQATIETFVEHQAPIEYDIQHLHVLNHRKIHTGDGYR